MAESVSEFVSRAPHPRLSPFIGEYTGYRIAGVPPGVHAGLPSRSLTLIIAFDDPIDVELTHGSEGLRREHWAMLGGLHANPALIRHPGRQHGVQISISPDGARALFGVPAAALAHEVVPLEALIPDAAAELVDRLSAAATWDQRWAELDDVLSRLMTEQSDPYPEVAAAWALLAETHGTIDVETLASSVGWHRRTLSGRFKDVFGLSPKLVARVMRFERAQRLLRLPTAPSLATVAHLCGYSDQAHMTREWVEFAGSAPTTWRNDETIPFVQDDGDAPLSS